LHWPGFQCKALVPTYHDVGVPPDRTTTQERRLCRAQAQPSVWIVLTEAGSPPSAAPVVLIPHWHYRDWQPRVEQSDQHAGPIGNFGIFRR
jgi:hypothetical protein